MSDAQVNQLSLGEREVAWLHVSCMEIRTKDKKHRNQVKDSEHGLRSRQGHWRREGVQSLHKNNILKELLLYFIT